MLKNNTKNIEILIFIMFITLGFSCKKKNISSESEYVDSFLGEKIRYVIAVVAAENSIFMSAEKGDTQMIGIKNAKVTLVQNDSIQTKKVDDKGMVHFSNLFAGNTVVKIECEGYTTANLIVDLTNIDSINNSISNNYRIVSTIVTLFPISEEKNMATIKGKLFADLDLTSDGLEIVTIPLLIRATIDPQDIYDYVRHSQSGRIIDLSYEDASFITKTENSNYSIKVSSSLRGLKFFIASDNFVAEQKISPSQTIRKIFFLETEKVTVYPGATIVKDLIYN